MNPQTQNLLTVIEAQQSEIHQQGILITLLILAFLGVSLALCLTIYWYNKPTDSIEDEIYEEYHD